MSAIQIPEEIAKAGLDSAAVQAAVDQGKVNSDAGLKTRSFADIFKENLCTLFNFINVVLAVFVAFTGSYKNMLFMVIIVTNVIIGIFQEIRSKRTTDRLAIVAASNAEVVRNGTLAEIPIDQLVEGDVVRLGRGNQIPADCKILAGECKANESLLTGESKLIPKAPGDELLSGSFISAGSVWAKLESVGADSYASKITSEAKQFKAVNSEIMTSLNTIIKAVSIFMFPVGALLFASSYFLLGTPLDSTILSTVSALVGMIPEGLILLTSTVLALAVVRLARYKVLVQQLYCIETLARVDVLCLDKTGTITTGNMEVFAEEPWEDASLETLQCAFAALASAEEDPNDTARAIAARYAGEASVQAAVRAMGAPTQVVPFSSETKWSGAAFAGGKAFAMGATEFLLASAPGVLAEVQPRAKELSAGGRLLLLAEVDGFTPAGAIVGTPKPLGFLCLRDEIRSTAAQTIQYFKEQGVTLKVISGDDPATVAGIAQKVGVPNSEEFVDATTLATDEDIASAIAKYSVFGRVRPEQKKAFVLALQAQGHTVAMTGDGVNDVLALKASDCSVAMASGSDAARNVAQLVLVNSDFASMPEVVAEGRRSINNLQRSASLFLVKTLLSITSAFLFIFLPWQYPFMPIQMTLISAFTIGIPSFVLALEPNHDRVEGHFLANCVVRSIPGAICALVSIILLNLVGYSALGITYEQVSTLCVIAFSFLGIMLVARLSVPFTPIRCALMVVVVGGTLLGLTVFGPLFNVAPFTTGMAYLLAAVLAANAVAFNLLYNKFDRTYRAKVTAQARKLLKG